MRTVPTLLAALLSAGCVSRSSAPVPTVPKGPCVSFGGVSDDHRWLTGNYKVMPVDAQYQATAISRVNRGELEEVDAAVAKAMTGRSALPLASHYYLVRVGYVGAAPVGTVNTGLSLSVDVDAEGVAYVSSFVLSHTLKRTEIAAVLSSSTRLKRVVSTCGSAE